MSFEYKKGDLIWIKIGKEAEGSEQKGNRPALVVQNNESNKVLRTILVAPITKAKNIMKLSPTHVFLEKEKSGLKYDSVILLDQTRTIDKKERALARISSVDEDIISLVNRAIKITFDLEIEFPSR